MKRCAKSILQNKKHWYTIFINDLVPDDEIIGMVEKSYELVNQ